MLRALVANIRAGQTVQGGSTLSQQLVKNYYLSNERSLIRKINEGFMAVLLELHYGKAEILEAYLNEIYLGQQGRHGIHGFGRASEFYFGKPLAQLDSAEIALLVGIVRGASVYNPRRNPQRALDRRNRVLAIFHETGLLTAAEAQAAAARPLGITTAPSSGHSRYPAFIDLVRRQLRSDYRDQDLQSAGLRIFTTLAPADQLLAEQAVVQGMRSLRDRGLPEGLQCALLLADIASGEIRAVVGDREPGRTGFNRALDARRQIGSVIKPLVYLAALEHAADYDLLTRVHDEPITLRQADGSLWSPENFDQRSHGEVTLLEALVHSHNQATVRLGMQVGVQQLLVKLRQLGIEAAVDPVPAALLGAVELTPLEVAQMYQSLASGGYSVKLRAVTSVQTAEGDSLGRYPLRLVPLPRRDALAVLNYALTQVVERGTARELPGLLRSEVTLAGKTGTTNEQRDSWFVGYTRDRVAVTWVGQDDNSPAGVTGGNAALRLWADLFRALPLKAVDLDMPDGAYWVWVEPELDALSDPSCPGAVQMPFIEGSEPVSESPCRVRLERQDRNSIWRKWFDGN
jgi:penicillin-binding protein 1B